MGARQGSIDILDKLLEMSRNLIPGLALESRHIRQNLDGKNRLAVNLRLADQTVADGRRLVERTLNLFRREVFAVRQDDEVLRPSFRGLRS